MNNPKSPWAICFGALVAITVIIGGFMLADTGRMQTDFDSAIQSLSTD